MGKIDVNGITTSDKNSEIVLLRSNIEKNKRSLDYADSAQARENQQRNIDFMETKLRELEESNNE